MRARRGGGQRLVIFRPDKIRALTRRPPQAPVLHCLAEEVLRLLQLTGQAPSHGFAIHIGLHALTTKRRHLLSGHRRVISSPRLEHVLVPRGAKRRQHGAAVFGAVAEEFLSHRLADNGRKRGHGVRCDNAVGHGSPEKVVRNAAEDGSTQGVVLQSNNEVDDLSNGRWPRHGQMVTSPPILVVEAHDVRVQPGAPGV